MTVPAEASYDFVLQDNRGFRSAVRINGMVIDASASALTIAQAFAVISTSGIATALQAMSNAKIISQGFSIRYDFAQEPSTETGTYELVQQKARLNFADGAITRSFLDLPAPVDALFLTSGQDNLVVVNPASSLITNLQTATAATHAFASRGQGTIFSQFFGGQLVQGKPRRRRVIQGS